MKVSDVMSNKVVNVSPTTKFKEIWSMFVSHKINAVPVVDAEKKLLGIIAKEDLLKLLYPNYLDLVDDFSKASDFEEMEDHVKDLLDLTARDLMNTHVIFTRGDTPAMRALSRMISRRVNQLPVLSGDDSVIGIITKGDVFTGLFTQQLKKAKLPRVHKAFIKV